MKATTSNPVGRFDLDEPTSMNGETPSAKPRLGITNQALIVGVLAAIAGWFLHLLSERNERDAALPTIPNRSAETDAATLVTIAPVSVRSIAQTIDLIGTLNCFEEIPISSKVDGTVLKVHCDVATRVGPGDLLIEIDPESYELDVTQAQRTLQVELAKLGLRELPPADWDVTSIPTIVQAQARLKLAENRLQRLRKLAADHAASDADLDSAVSEFETGKAERDSQFLSANANVATIQMKQTALEIAQRKLKDTRIAAPTSSYGLPISASGETPRPLFVVAERMVSEGAYLRAGTQVLKLVVDGRLKMNASVPEKFSQLVAMGQQASITTAAQSEPIFGAVTNIHPTVDPKNRTFGIEIQVDNRDGRLKAGNFAKATVQVGQRENSTTVPLESIVTTGGLNKLFVLEDGKAREYPVQIGIQTNEWVEILKPPFAIDATVITSGQSQLSTGSVVEVREPIQNSRGAPNDQAIPTRVATDSADPQP